MVSPILWGALVAASEAGLAVVAVSARRSLKRRGARPAAFVLLGVGVLLSLLSPLYAALIGGWVSVVLLVPVGVVYFAPGAAVLISGGPLPRWGLARDAKRIRQRWEALVESGGVTEADEVWLTEQSGRLDRWRSRDTAELIDLYQEKIGDLLNHEDREQFRRRVTARNARIDELLVSFWQEGEQDRQ
jgi:hypothetical protein